MAQEDTVHTSAAEDAPAPASPPTPPSVGVSPDKRRTLLLLVAAFITVMMFTGLLRLSEYSPSLLSPFAGYATLLYIAATIGFALLIAKTGVDFNRFGFAQRVRLAHVGLAVVGVIALQLSGMVISPVLETLLGEGRDLQRFSGIEGSLGTLLSLVLLSWTVAAFGEEIAFRNVMMRSLQSLFGGGRGAVAAALVIQALVFGFIHIYQGPAGVIGSTISGLVFGGLVIAGRGAIWPAALAHGANNTIGLSILYNGG